MRLPFNMGNLILCNVKNIIHIYLTEN